MKAHLKTLLIASLATMALSPGIGQAEVVPLAHEASPEIYRVMHESDQLRVIMSTFQPGQRDEFHSHPAHASYVLDNCMVRFIAADGQVQWEGPAYPGFAKAYGPTVKHSVQNIGSAPCRILVVERK